MAIHFVLQIVKIEVFDSNGAIRTITDSNVIDSGLYRGPSFPTVTPNSNSSIVVFKVRCHKQWSWTFKWRINI
jgi:hypothetical protein